MNNNKTKKKIASFFAGVGGIDIAFSKAGFNVVWANEIDRLPIKTYRLNNKNEIVEKDIKKVNIKEIPKFDILIGGFPCQAFSVAGYRKGFDDERGTLFFDLLKVIKEKKPEIIFLENVKNLETHDKGKTFKIIKESLEKEGYYIKNKVLNACEYGNIPQNRERIYIVGFKNKKQAEKFEFPEKIKLTTTIYDFVDFNKKVDDKYYYTNKNCLFYDKLKEKVKKEGVIYQWRRVYVRENKSNLCPTLTANMGTGGHNVPLIYTKNGIRKLTPRECFNIMGFDENFKLPDDTANTSLYKQAGNSVIVPVIYRIAKKILKVIS